MAKKTKSRVNEAGNYTQPAMRKRLYNKILKGSKGGKPGQWSGRKAQLLVNTYEIKGGGYTNGKARKKNVIKKKPKKS